MRPKALALQNVKRRAIVKADKLNIRSAPSKDADSVGTALQNERYEVLGEQDGFVQTRSGYISEDYVEIQDCLNEARKQDLRAWCSICTIISASPKSRAISNIRDGAERGRVRS